MVGLLYFTPFPEFPQKHNLSDALIAMSIHNPYYELCHIIDNFCLSHMHNTHFGHNKFTANAMTVGLCILDDANKNESVTFMIRDVQTYHACILT